MIKLELITSKLERIFLSEITENEKTISLQ